jgi:hypothetical protein
LGQRVCQRVERRRRGTYDRRSHVAHQCRELIVIQGLCRPVEEMGTADMVNRCLGQAGFDQFDPAAIHDLVVSGRGHRDGPAEVVSDAETHADDSASKCRSGAEYSASLEV